MKTKSWKEFCIRSNKTVYWRTTRQLELIRNKSGRGKIGGFHSKLPSAALRCATVCALYVNVNHEGRNPEMPHEFACICLCLHVWGACISDAG